MWQTIGHEWAVEALQRSVESGRIAQANLFTGPHHIGKTHLALEFAAALVCEGESPPCGTCRGCRLVKRQAHPDVFVMEPEDGRIRIDQVRALQHELALSPYEAEWRIAIIRRFEMSTVQAGNALLKTLEEPPERAVIIITAADAGLLLPTIVSRCRVMALRTVPAGTIREALVTQSGLSDERAELLARLSAGHVGWALRAADDKDALAERQEDAETFFKILQASSAARIRAVELLYQRDDLDELIRLWQMWWRDILLAKIDSLDLIVNLDFVEEIQRSAQRYSVEQAQRAMRSAEYFLEQLEHNVNARLALEVLVLNW